MKKWKKTCLTVRLNQKGVSIFLTQLTHCRLSLMGWLSEAHFLHLPHVSNCSH